jgi:hypothetical protein
MCVSAWAGYVAWIMNAYAHVCGPLSLVTTAEGLLGRKNNGSDLESREYGHGDPSRWPRGTLYPQ